MNAVATAEAFAAPDAEIAFDAEVVPQKLFSSRGRVGVMKYFAQTFLWSMVFTLIMVAIVAGAGALGMMDGGVETIAASLGGVTLLLMLPFLFVMACFGIKRLHDINMSGWFCLLLMVPVVNIVFGLYMILKPGKPEANRFGAPSVTKGWEKVVGGLYIALMVLSVVGVLLAAGAGGMSALMQ